MDWIWPALCTAEDWVRREMQRSSGWTGNGSGGSLTEWVPFPVQVFLWPNAINHHLTIIKPSFYHGLVTQWVPIHQPRLGVILHHPKIGVYRIPNNKPTWRVNGIEGMLGNPGPSGFCDSRPCFFRGATGTHNQTPELREAKLIQGL